jgi:glycosyltransferase involved in cell wall biosynthesis
MRIAFNAQRLAGQRFGVGRYIEYMLRHWAPALAGDESLTVFLRKPLDVPIGPPNARVDYVLLESDMSGLPWETLKLRGAAAKHDVLFCPAYSAPLGFRAPFVVATHSVNETSHEAHDWRYRQTYSRLYRHCARRAGAVIVPGERTARAVIDYYGVDPRKVSIVHQGADDAFQPVADDAALRAARAQFFGPERPYILFVGKGSERRNIPRLVEAFASLRKSGQILHGLVLFGPYHGTPPIMDLAAKLGIADDVIQTDGVVAHHADLAAIYAGADAFVHPSENEGWSMTTTEALACGVPVIASNRGGLGEVAAGHAYMLADPSVAALTEALARVLTDEALRTDLKQKARVRGAALRWDVLAGQTLDVVRATVRNARDH